MGTMHDVVYDVNGGFEDWAYGASWDKDSVPHTCGKNLLNSNPVHHSDQSNRAFVYLIEAGYDKTP